LPFGAFLQKTFSGSSTYILINSLKKYGILSCILFFVCLNIIQTYQCKMAMIHFDSMNKVTYWQVFGKFEFVDDYQQRFYESLSKIDYEKAVQGSGREDI
jgi:hypothetical protein